MASSAPNQNLPLFYSAIEPLNATQHADKRVRAITRMPQLGRAHAIPVTVDEFTLAQRHYPIVFAVGGNPVPIALMGLNEGVNVFLDEDGRALDNSIYLPAYIRRYPFLLAILQFCEQFEAAGQRTAAFVDEVIKADLLMDGEVAIQPEGAEQPFIYRGFRMIDEEKLRNLRGDELRKMNQSGLLALIHAHLFSLSEMRNVFARQMQQGKAPAQVPMPAPADA
jgi:hypothetical protein